MGDRSGRCTTCNHDEYDHVDLQGGCVLVGCRCVAFVSALAADVDASLKYDGIDLDKPGGITMVPLGESMRAAAVAVAELEERKAAELAAVRRLAWEGWSKVYAMRETMRSTIEFLDG